MGGLNAAEIDLLRAMGSGRAQVVWDIHDGGYFYRYDTHQRCTAAARTLVAAGFVALPVFGMGRDCAITDAGRAELFKH